MKVFEPICTTALFVWAKGGEPLYLPENIGLPLNQEGLEEYVYMELHYDNPGELEGVQYETGVHVFLTGDLRPVDAGMWVVSNPVDRTQLVPPDMKEFVTVAHCSSRCMAQQYPEDGITIFYILHHAHLAGRKMKFRHFRPQQNGSVVELPWISYDDYYDFDFQQNRPLREPLKILPGDHMTIECTYDTTGITETTFGGWSTRDEMCEAIFLYYPLQPFLYCGSFMPFEKSLPVLGIEEFDPLLNSTTIPTDPIVLSPAEYAGHSLSTVCNTMLEWTPQMKKKLRSQMIVDDHVEECFARWEASKKHLHGEIIWTNYPKDFVPYVPPKRN